MTCAPKLVMYILKRFYAYKGQIKQYVRYFNFLQMELNYIYITKLYI